MKVQFSLKWLLGLLMLVIGFVMISPLSAQAAGFQADAHTIRVPLPDGSTVSVPKTDTSPETIPLYKSDGTKTSFALAAGDSFATNATLINLNTEKVYYRVAVADYVISTDVQLNVANSSTSVELAVHYVDTENHSLKPTQTFSVDNDQVDDFIAGLTSGTPDVAIDGYQLSDTKSGSHEVTFIYQPDQTSVTFKYIDTAGHALSADKTLSGKPGSAYTIPDPAGNADLKGYDLKEIQGGTPSGTFDTTDQTFTYVYQKAPSPVTPVAPTTPSVVAAPVTVRYQTTTGTQLTQDQVLTGDLGAPYQTTQKDFAHYQLAKIIGQPTGRFTTSAQDVTYVYEPAQGTAIRPFMIYAKRGLYHYASPTFTRAQRLAFVKQQPRVKAATFKVVDTATSTTGKLRYRLADGTYITANPNFVANLYWQGTQYRQLRVTNPQGAYLYATTRFSTQNRRTHLKKGKTVTVRRIIHTGMTTRYQLTSGQYITGNKQWVTPFK